MDAHFILHAGIVETYDLSLTGVWRSDRDQCTGYPKCTNFFYEITEKLLNCDLSM